MIEMLQESALDNRYTMVALEASKRAYKPRVVLGPASLWEAINIEEIDQESATKWIKESYDTVMCQSNYRGTPRRFNDKDWLFGQLIIPHVGPTLMMICKSSQTVWESTPSDENPKSQVDKGRREA